MIANRTSVKKHMKKSGGKDFPDLFNFDLLLTLPCTVQSQRHFSFFVNKDKDRTPSSIPTAFVC